MGWLDTHHEWLLVSVQSLVVVKYLQIHNFFQIQPQEGKFSNFSHIPIRSKSMLCMLSVICLLFKLGQYIATL